MPARQAGEQEEDRIAEADLGESVLEGEWSAGRGWAWKMPSATRTKERQGMEGMVRRRRHGVQAARDRAGRRDRKRRLDSVVERTSDPFGVGLVVARKAQKGLRRRGDAESWESRPS